MLFLQNHPVLQHVHPEDDRGACGKSQQAVPSEDLQLRTVEIVSSWVLPGRSGGLYSYTNSCESRSGDRGQVDKSKSPAPTLWS